MDYFFFIILGLIFGSFASVVIHRLHTSQKGIFLGRSRCPQCAEELGARDLIPVLSYVINKAKCRFCKDPIAFRYPLLELTMGGFFGLTYYLVHTEPVWTIVFYLLITFIFVLLTFYDFLFKEVPDEVSLPAIILAIVFAVITKSMPLSMLAVGILLPVFFFGGLFFGSQGRWLGGGDIRIGALMGALLGWPMILLGLFLGYLSGAIYSGAGLLTGKFNRKTQIPFVPFLLLGTYISLFWGAELVEWYIGLI